MGRDEIITKIQNNINKFYKNCDSVGEDERELLSEIFDDVEKLRHPITLADFLGWEDNTEYKYGNDKFIIMDDRLYVRNYAKRAWTHDYCVDINIFEQLRQAKKIKPKKFYAKIKGTELLQKHTDFRFFYFTPIRNGMILSSLLHKKEQQIRTKEEWANLGITEKNADFEEVEE